MFHFHSAFASQCFLNPAAFFDERLQHRKMKALKHFLQMREAAFLLFFSGTWHQKKGIAPVSVTEPVYKGIEKHIFQSFVVQFLKLQQARRKGAVVLPQGFHRYVIQHFSFPVFLPLAAAFSADRIIGKQQAQEGIIFLFFATHQTSCFVHDLFASSISLMHCSARALRFRVRNRTEPVGN